MFDETDVRAPPHARARARSFRVSAAYSALVLIRCFRECNEAVLREKEKEGGGEKKTKERDEGGKKKEKVEGREGEEEKGERESVFSDLRMFRRGKRGERRKRAGSK